MKHQWNGEIPSPGGKVARRKPGRMRNGDAVGQGMHPNKTDKGFGFIHFYGVHRNILLFAVPHQSPKSVPKCRFGRQLYELRCDCHWQSIDFDSLRGAPPPGEAMSAAAPIRYTTVNVLTKADNLNHFYKADTALRRYYALRTAVGGCALYARCSGCTEYRIFGVSEKMGLEPTNDTPQLRY